MDGWQNGLIDDRMDGWIDDGYFVSYLLSLEEVMKSHHQKQDTSAIE